SLRMDAQAQMTPLAKYARMAYPNSTTVAGISRNSSGQLEALQQFAPAWTALGGTYQGTTISPTNPTIAQYKAVIPNLVAGNPQMIFASTAASEMPNFLDAWVQLSADTTFTKPSNFDSVLIFNAASLPTYD